MKRPTRTAAAVTAAALVVGGLAGCSTQRPGSAATVDGDRISVGELQSLAREYLRVVPGEDPGAVQRGILDQLITNEVYDRVSRELGVRVSNGRAANQLGTLVERFEGRKPLVQAILTSQERPEYVAPSMLERWLENQLTFIKITRDLNGGELPTDEQAGNAAFALADNRIAEIAAAMDVSLSPRYGTWAPDSDIDPTVSDITGLVSGGLSKTAEELDPADQP